MRGIQDPKLAQLLMQLRFTPETKRRRQLAAAEDLYRLIESDHEYPLDFVWFRITGFAPREPMDGLLLGGAALREDLRIFIAKLSGKLADDAGALGEKVYTIDTLAEQFGVSIKTVNRWRKRGLLAKKFIFEDGVKRLGFPESVVYKFTEDHPDLVANAVAFRRLTKPDKQAIIKHVRSLARKGRTSRHQLIEQTAAALSLSHETVRMTLVQYEKRHGGKSALAAPLGRLTAAQCAEAYRLYRQGISVPELSRRFNRSRTSIYRVINQRRAAAILAMKIDYVASDEFAQPDARQRLLSIPLYLNRPDPTRHPEPFELLGEQLLPEYLQVLKTTPVLTREQETDLFRRYNFLKFLAAARRQDIRLARVSSTLLTEIEQYLGQAEQIRQHLVEANLRLVVSIASKHTTGGAGFLDLVSKGNYALIKAVEEFDHTKGFRFSKRASLSIAKEYARVSDRGTELTRKRAASLAQVQRGRIPAADVVAIERARHSLAQVMNEELDERQRYVILHHFGLIGTPIRKQTKTLKQIGDELGLSKERVRQIELLALQRLRQSLSEEEFELLTR